MDKKSHKTYCKEFHETGTCRYKEHCKYAHVIIQNEKECKICNMPFVEKVTADCKHSFCFKCAFDEYQKTEKCFICKMKTFGRFKIE